MCLFFPEPRAIFLPGYCFLHSICSWWGGKRLNHLEVKSTVLLGWAFPVWVSSFGGCIRQVRVLGAEAVSEGWTAVTFASILGRARASLCTRAEVSWNHGAFDDCLPLETRSLASCQEYLKLVKTLHSEILSKQDSLPKESKDLKNLISQYSCVASRLYLNLPACFLSIFVVSLSYLRCRSVPFLHKDHWHQFWSLQYFAVNKMSASCYALGGHVGFGSLLAVLGS